MFYKKWRPPRWRRGSGLDFGSEEPCSILGLPSPRVGPLMARRLKTSSDVRCPCRGRLGTLKTPSCPWRWVPGRSKFGNWTTVPSLYSRNIAECDFKPQPTNQQKVTRLYRSTPCQNLPRGCTSTSHSVCLFSDWEGKGPCAIVPFNLKMAHKSLCRIIRNGPLKISKSLKKAENGPFSKNLFPITAYYR